MTLEERQVLQMFSGPISNTSSSSLLPSTSHPSAPFAVYHDSQEQIPVMPELEPATAGSIPRPPPTPPKTQTGKGGR